MSFAARAALPYARAYLRLAGKKLDDDRLRAGLERSAAGMPLAARWIGAIFALAMRWLFPLLFLGRWRRFDGLSPDDADALLSRLQCARLLPLKGGFLILKSLVLPVCYGEPAPGKNA